LLIKNDISTIQSVFGASQANKQSINIKEQRKFCDDALFISLACAKYALNG
jgi:hypothetical protein